MSHEISKTRLLKFAFDLRVEGMNACELAHEEFRKHQQGTADYYMHKQAGITKKQIAQRIEELFVMPKKDTK